MICTCNWNSSCKIRTNFCPETTHHECLSHHTNIFKRIADLPASPEFLFVCWILCSFHQMVWFSSQTDINCSSCWRLFNKRTVSQNCKRFNYSAQNTKVDWWFSLTLNDVNSRSVKWQLKSWTQQVDIIWHCHMATLFRSSKLFIMKVWRVKQRCLWVTHFFIFEFLNSQQSFESKNLHFYNDDLLLSGSIRYVQ